MSQLNAQILAHLSVCWLFLSGLAGIGHLTWNELARLLAIVVGLIVAFWRYRDRLSEPFCRRTASIILTFLLAYMMVQFDPITSNIGYHEKHFKLSPLQVATLVVSFLPIAAALACQRRRELLPKAWDRLDWVVFAIVFAVLTIGILSKLVLPGPSIARFSWAKILSFGCLWAGVTRLYGTQTWLPDSFPRFNTIWNRWSGPMLLAGLVFVPTLGYGSIRVGSVLYHSQAGFTAFSREDYERALTHYARAEEWNNSVRLDSLRDRYLADVAVLRFREGSKGAAQEAISRIRENTLDVMSADLKEADIYLRTKQWSRAERLLTKVVEIAGKDTSVLDKLGLAQLEMRNVLGFERLWVRYQYMPKVAADTYEESVFLGNIHFYQGRYGDALTYYQQALLMQPSSSYSMYKAGRARRALADRRGAIEYFRRAVLADSQFADAHYYLGLCRHDLGDSSNALTHYQKVKELLPSHLLGRVPMSDSTRLRD